ncbi:MAG: UDP-N-acetylglucosamine 2-epimerase (non-hydrolyzing) [Caldilineaceae bacterium]|nr:UDP-N-acetylglucosamine 2-epimerase (non-hydrolyzing) [Caldilineaceae bacterium]HRJ40480.1 UDP-N-acetylglucosamine 2-epimerase (non-hydrolyzing) [Caldilineaceae bacterium]
MHILHVVGARPNFMKAAPVYRACVARGIRQTIVHSGQHYDANMSDIFFTQLGIPQPDFNLEVGSGSHAQQTATIMQRMEPIVIEQRPDWVLVYGDVNSTLAGTIVCSKLGQLVAHVEAGLRSFDRTMPEEINRLLTDQVADLLFTHSEEAAENLTSEGVAAERIHFVGNVMIDTLIRLLPQCEPPQFPGVNGRYVLVTLHRPSNVDNPAALHQIMRALERVDQSLAVIFPVHPRTRRRLEEQAYKIDNPQLHLIEPLGYQEFIGLQRNATAVITDSGGVQEETTFLQIPCLTLRSNTERPVTVTIGTNKLIGSDPDRIISEINAILAGNGKKGAIPTLWDGHAGERIVDILMASHL